MLRRCSNCDEDKDAGADFYLKNGKPRSVCKSCFGKAARRRQRSDPNYRRLHRRRNRIRVKHLREIVLAHKAAPCVDCGHPFPPCAMQFDHLGIEPKTANISELVQRGTKKALLAEIAKCEVVCANRHTVRTERRRLDLDRTKPR